jgi:tRNA dimethylallyltransferase
LDIATNKVNDEQMDRIPHHLIGYLKPFYTNINVLHEYRKKALEIIQKIWDERKLPILVGGTFYYMEAIVFDNNLVQNQLEESSKLLF